MSLKKEMLKQLKMKSFPKMKICNLCGGINDWGKFASEEEKNSGICSDCLNKPFPITSVARADLLKDFTPKQIASLGDGDMEHLASKMADTYCENSFWIDLEILTEDILKEKKL